MNTDEHRFKVFTRIIYKYEYILKNQNQAS